MDFSNDPLPPSPEALEQALLSIQDRALVPGKRHSICLPVPPATPSSVLTPPLQTSMSWSSFCDLGIVISQRNLFDDADEDEGFVMLDFDASEAASPSSSGDINEQSWLCLTPSPALPSSSILPMASPEGAITPLQLPSPTPLYDHLTGLGVRVLDWETGFGDIDFSEEAPLLADAAPMAYSSPSTVPSFSNRSSAHSSNKRKAPPAPLSLGASSSDWDAPAIIAPTLEPFAQENESLEEVVIYPSRAERLAAMRSLRDKAWLRTAVKTPLPEEGKILDLWEEKAPVIEVGLEEGFEEWVERQTEGFEESVKRQAEVRMRVLEVLLEEIRGEMGGL